MINHTLIRQVNLGDSHRASGERVGASLAMEALDLGANEDLDSGHRRRDDVLGLLDESFPAAPAVTLPAAPTPAASTPAEPALAENYSKLSQHM